MFDPIWSNMSQYKSWQAWNTSRNMPNFDVAMATCSVAVSFLFSHILLCIYVLSIFSIFYCPESRVQSPESRIQNLESRIQSPESRVQGPVQILYYAVVV